MSQHRVKVSTIPYFAYAAFVFVKKAMGLGGNRNRKFLVWKLIRLIDQGKISTENISVTSTGKNDGVGAQAMAKFSAMCFAEEYGIKYVHAPFESLAHAEDPRELWTESWERLLDMNIHDILLDTNNMLVVKLDEYLESPELWTEKAVISDLHFHPVCQLAPATGTAVSSKLRSRFLNHESNSSPSDDFIIGVHVRLGDVRKGDTDTGHRFIENKEIISVVERVSDVASAMGYKPKIHIHTNGSSEEVRDFSKFGNVTFYTGVSALKTFTELTKSNILIAARSDFSMLAGIYTSGIVICDPRHRTPLEGWIKNTMESAEFKKELHHRLNSKKS